MSGTTCNWAGREEVFEGYVRNALGADERDAFEEHYFSCAACFDKLRTYRALRAELGAARQPWPVRRRRPVRVHGGGCSCRPLSEWCCWRP